MSTKKWKNMDAGLLTMIAKVARNEALSAADEASIADFLKGYAGTRGDWGFATTPTGDVRGSNNLRRTNWFNGRYLTAEALSRQDVYFDVRLTDAWVWDVYRSSRFVKNVRIVTFKDVNVEEVQKTDIDIPDSM